MLVTPELFKVDTEIGQSDSTFVIEELEQAIAQYEPEYLRAMFGYQAAAALMVTPTVAPWINIIDGAEFTNIYSQMSKWNGLKAPGNSPIVYYVYYWYLRNNVSNSTGGGESIIKKLNSRQVTNRRKQTWAWNRMVDLNWDLLSFMKVNPTLYPTVLAYSRDRRSYEFHNLFTKINSLNL